MPRRTLHRRREQGTQREGALLLQPRYRRGGQMGDRREYQRDLGQLGPAQAPQRVLVEFAHVVVERVDQQAERHVLLEVRARADSEPTLSGIFSSLRETQ